MSTPDGIVPVNIEDEIKKSYMDYAMSVIIGRALPDVRDGLKPVQRRILFSMHRGGLTHASRYRKCAEVVGDVLGKLHPHGDQAVYDALVRMAQEWNLRYTLVDGQGNFGSIDGDPPAAYRYTECRMDRLAEELLADIEKETVDFVPNYNQQDEEPTVLPGRFPNLLANGASGIAVGMATNIPPHNLRELCDGLTALIANPAITIPELMRLIPGPDFPTGAAIHGRDAIRQAFETGRGVIQVRARTEIEINEKQDRQTIVVHEIPYQVNKAKLIEKIAELVRDKKVDGISDVRDESDRHGMRVVIELKRGEDGNIVLNQLYKHTPLQTGFGIIFLAIVQQEPRVLNLKEMLELFLKHRKEVITRRTRYELKKAEERAHILEGLKKAIDHLDEVIALIRRSVDPEAAKTGLMGFLDLSELQAQAILDMKLQRLTNLERDKIIQEYEEVLRLIARLKEILANERLVLQIIADDLKEIREKYGDERRTAIVAERTDLDIEDLIPQEDVVISVSHAGYVKRTSVSTYRGQRRGGKGRIGMRTKEEDFVQQVFVVNSHAYMLCFTEQGKMYWLKAYEVPEASAAGKGKAVVNLLNLSSEEKLAAILPVGEFVADRYVFMTTRKGIVKKTALMAFSNVTTRGIIAAEVAEGDRLLSVQLTDGNQEVLIGTREGLSVRFHESDVREMGRTARGVIGIRLEEGDEVVGAIVLREGDSILTVAGKGMGKRSAVEDYRLQTRGGKGVINMKITGKTGQVVSVLAVRDENDLMVMSEQGMILRTHVADMRVIGRATQGVRVINLDEGDRVTSVARLDEREEENGGEPVPAPGEGGPQAE